MELKVRHCHCSCAMQSNAQPYQSSIGVDKDTAVTSVPVGVQCGRRMGRPRSVCDICAPGCDACCRRALEPAAAIRKQTPIVLPEVYVEFTSALQGRPAPCSSPELHHLLSPWQLRPVRSCTLAPFTSSFTPYGIHTCMLVIRSCND